MFSVGTLSVLTYGTKKSKVRLARLGGRDLKSVTYAVLGHLGDVVEDGLVGVARSVVGVLALVVCVGTHDSGVSVFELGGTSELGSSLGVLVLFSHCEGVSNPVGVKMR